MPSSILRAAAALAFLAPIGAQSVTTIYTGGNSGPTNWTIQFDITVLNPAGAWITAIDTSCENTRSGGVGSPFTIDVWVTQLGGTYVGNQTNPSAWTRLVQGRGVSRVMGTPTPVDLPDFFLAQGRYGIALEFVGTAMSYTNGNGTNQRYANADIQLDLGSATTNRFGTPLYDPRVWNGTVYYFVGNATYRSFGAGCAGAGGIPAIAAAPGSLPRLGTTFQASMTNLPQAASPISMLLGVSTEVWSGAQLPLSLAPLNMPGCALHVSLDFSLPTVGVNGSGTFQLPIPNSVSLTGGRLLMQALVSDPTANAFGFSMSNAGEIYIGN